MAYKLTVKSLLPYADSTRRVFRRQHVRLPGPTSVGLRDCVDRATAAISSLLAAAKPFSLAVNERTEEIDGASDS